MFGKRFTILLFALSLAAAHASISTAQDANPLPAPTGQFAVGRVWRHWVDESRKETSGATHGPREIMVELLYPAQADTSAKFAPYMDYDGVAITAFSNTLSGAGVPVKADPSMFTAFQSHAIADAPVASGTTHYPVLIFSHGAGGEAQMYAGLLEDLASHGYIVAAIDHPYGAAATVFPDGRTVLGDLSEGLEFYAPIWAQDERFALDQLETLNAKDPDGLLTGHLDLSRVGFFGHSVGGGAATTACSLDTRCKATVNLDGPIFGDVLKHGLAQPVLFLQSDSHVFGDATQYAKTHGPFYEADFHGFEHLDFGDFTVWPIAQAELKASNWLGKEAGPRAIEVTRAYVLGFFDQYLKGIDSPLLKGASADYPEVKLTSRNLPSS